MLKCPRQSSKWSIRMMPESSTVPYGRGGEELVRSKCHQWPRAEVGTVEIIVMYVLFVVGIAWWANQWDRSAGGWGLLALLISPLIAAIGLAVVGRAKPTAVVPGPNAAATLATLADLRDRGAISDTEFAVKKQELLARV